MTTSLIISTYNWPQALQRCLDSVLRQNSMPTEILIADDGSDARTRQVVERFRELCPVRVQHIWQEDRGFRLAAIRNKAIAASQGDYLIQIDGDLILHPDFIGDHCRFARRGYFTAGSRGRITQPLLERALYDTAFRPSPLTPHIGSRINTFHCGLAALLYRNYGPHRFVKGCNMAFWRDDLIRVNGYDEAFEGWGAEDGELAARLTHAAIRQQNLKFAAIVYHIFHGQHDRENRADNDRRLDECRAQRLTRCEEGLSRYLEVSTNR